jgi:predicted transcriptional regulator
MNTIIDNELELDILQHILQSPGAVRQRDLATVVGKSLGMTNAILHRLTEKGMLTVLKVNNRNISYAVTPWGMRELAGRSYRYFKRTIKNVVDYKDAIEAELCGLLRTMAAERPPADRCELLLVGPSDLDFILEYLAAKYQLVLSRAGGAGELGQGAVGTNVIVFLSEETNGDPAVECRFVVRLRSFIA